MTRFHVVISREDGSFPVDIQEWRPARGSVIVGESDMGVDALAFVGDDVARLVQNAVALANIWEDVRDERLVLSVLVRVPNAYDCFCEDGRVGELAHVGYIDEDDVVIVNPTDARVWDELRGVAVRFV